jgi:hypothetical protein
MFGICSEQVQEVVLSADIQCSECQKRVADIMSKMTGKISIRPCIEIFRFFITLAVSLIEEGILCMVIGYMHPPLRICGSHRIVCSTYCES